MDHLKNYTLTPHTLLQSNEILQSKEATASTNMTGKSTLSPYKSEVYTDDSYWIKMYFLMWL